MKTDSKSKIELIELLKQAAKDNPKSKTAQLREIFDEIESIRTAHGLKLRTIVEVLREWGLEFDLDTFVNLRQRIKNERKKAGTTAPQPPPAAAPAAAPAPAAPVGGGRPSILSTSKRKFGELKPSPVDGTVDLKQK